MIARMFKDGLRVVPPVLTVPFEIVVATDNVNLPPQQVKIEYDEDGLHFITNLGMATLNEKNVGEGEIIEESNDVLPALHDQGVSE